MVCNGKPLSKMDDWVVPYFLGNTHLDETILEKINLKYSTKNRFGYKVGLYDLINGVKYTI